ncbi:MAG: hypothetical protein GXY04_03555 [Acholeplasmataceae bacterium]|nr:hypothetical protein [Acholeplasmataceae bacterium]HPM15493.1 hypothetical protein [Bacilli bacterium]HPY55264.1 hypothetical protein [Bacilli bacterium]
MPPNLNIEKHPIIDMVNSAIALGLSRNDMANYISMLVSKDILKYYAKSGKKLLFTYHEYLDILKKDTETVY